METINTWWQGLTGINQGFYVAAVFFGVFFLWQFISTFLGLGTDHGIDSHVEPASVHHAPEDAGETVVAFKLVSVRSVLAFFTLFSWAGALYLNIGRSLNWSLSVAMIWGLAAMLIVSLLLYWMRKLVETGNIRVASCVGASATVYLDIAVGGSGEIRALCSGVMTHLQARAASGQAIKAGTPVRVTRILEPNVVEVEIDPPNTERKEN